MKDTGGIGLFNMKNSTSIKILALTGIRSEYDLMFPLLQLLHKDDSFDLGIIVSGAHLSPLHNYSVNQIIGDQFKIVDRIENLLYTDSLSGKAKSSSILMQSLCQTLERERPNYLIVLGDREESVIGALVANYMNIAVIHIAGGDNTHPTTGNVDEQVRHATTKLSHIHLTMAEEHTQRVLKMGEEPWRVFTVGNGGIDRLRNEPSISKDELSASLGDCINQPYAVIIYHPLNSDMSQAAKEVRLCIEQSLKQNLHVFIGSPNSDPGYQDIIKVIEEFRMHPKVTLYKNLNRDVFVNVLRNAACLIGNSSLGFHEAPYLSLPAINVGQRQRGRMHGANVQIVDANEVEIQEALKKALYDLEYKEQLTRDRYIYGDGHMAEKAIDIIRQLPSGERILAKKLMY